MANKIEHIVVLMMENRSFDHMLGFLKRPNYPIDGLDGNETNPDSQAQLVQVSHDAHYAGDLTPDPGHDFISVNEQIFGNSQGTGNGPFMKGFVKAYQGITKNVDKSHNIMRCFNPSRIPALATLAQEFAVCDRWFASVPGPTLPNRAFAYGATSLGRVDMTPLYLQLKTIFERLDENGVSSKIYSTDWSLGMGVGFLIKNAKKFLFFFDDFKKDCKNNKLPAFCFVEPRFNDLSTSGEFFPAADQHPDHNVFQGEKVIKAVYDAIRNNQKTWESTLLVITYDEHGGIYDHVTPPATVNPEPNRPPGIFNFERLGVRVPAVLVSPYIPKRTIINDRVFDHASIISTARKVFLKGVPNSALTERDRNANTFEDCLTLASPRQDKVTIPNPSDALPPLTNALLQAAGITHAPGNAGVTAGFALPRNLDLSQTSNNPLNDLQAAMVQHAFAFEALRSPADHTDTRVSAVTTEQGAAEYLAGIRRTIERSRRRRPSRARNVKSGAAKSKARKTSKKK
ncbi:MAG TPA: phosphoesterase [Blastocatellia bacterium]|nr:phosphoesterase [Blastocatellia bacterium]